MPGVQIPKKSPKGEAEKIGRGKILKGTSTILSYLNLFGIGDFCRIFSRGDTR